MDIPSILGVVGATLVCLAYAALQLNVNPKGLAYNVTNLLGAILLGYSLLYNWNLGSFMIEIFWSLIAVSALFNLYYQESIRSSSFTTPFVYQRLGESRTFMMTEPFTFYVYLVNGKMRQKSGTLNERKFYTVRAGFLTDFASLPFFLDRFVDPEGPWAKAAALHDYLYRFVDLRANGLTRKQADQIFYIAMSVMQVPWIIRVIFYLGVRIGGSKHWKYYALKDIDFALGETVKLDTNIFGISLESFRGTITGFPSKGYIQIDDQPLPIMATLLVREQE